jgi:hypothetical protein
MNDVKNIVATIIATAKDLLNTKLIPVIFKCGVTKIKLPKNAPMNIVSKKMVRNIGYWGLLKSANSHLNFSDPNVVRL